MKNSKILPMIFAVASCCLACKKIVSVNNPIDRITAEKIFATDANARSAVAGVYSQMMVTTLYFYSGACTIYPALSADELVYTGVPGDMSAFNNNTLLPTTSTLNLDIWGKAYMTLYQINTCIEGLNNSTAITPTLKNQLLGEMKTARAFAYYHLSALYGDVPLVLSTNYTINATMPRTPIAQIQQQIITDLTEAAQLLNNNNPITDKSRPNKWTALALLARTYLLMGNWSEAEAITTAIIQSNAFTLTNNLNNVFLANSSEAIWQLAPVTALFNTVEGNRFIPASAAVRPTFILSDNLLNAFENNDLRRINWVRTNTISGIPHPYPFKYKIRNATTVTEYYTLIRFAEIYLIRSEARANLNNLTGAISDVNIIRSRAGLPALQPTTQANAFLAIEQERRIELFAEWGHRWIDLKRTGKINIFLAALKPNWQAFYALYPIPEAEIRNNPFLVQNQGY